MALGNLFFNIYGHPVIGLFGDARVVSFYFSTPSLSTNGTDLSVSFIEKWVLRETRWLFLVCARPHFRPAFAFFPWHYL